MEEGEYNPLKRGWFVYSQSELKRFGGTFPKVTLALRQNVQKLN